MTLAPSSAGCARPASPTTRRSSRSTSRPCVFADRYERRSTIVTSNLAFSEWVRVFGDEKLTTALLDRLSHHAHILATKGSSYRTRLRTKTS